jgi:hypothetical protein
MQTEEALHLVTLDLFEQMQQDGMLYAEIRFVPLLHMARGPSPEQVRIQTFGCRLFWAVDSGSAGLTYGRVQSWIDDPTVAFANTLAALFCSAPDGISSPSATEVLEGAASRDVQLTKPL